MWFLTAVQYFNNTAVLRFQAVSDSHSSLVLAGDARERNSILLSKVNFNV